MKTSIQPVTEMHAEAAPPQSRNASRKSPTGETCNVLHSEEYAEWDDLVDRSPHGTVFHYSWWLQTNATEFEILGVRNEHGMLIAGLPIPSQRRLGLRLLHSPQLTPFLGPIFDLSGADGVCDKLYLMRSNGELLARHVKSFDSFRYFAGACAPDLQGFLWAGFHVELAYTFRIPSTHSAEQITAGMTRTHLQKLRKAMRSKLTVSRNEGLEDMIDLNRRTYERQQLKPAYSPEFLRRLWNAAYEQERADLYVARTSENKPAAALLTVHDKRTTYQIVSGLDTELRDVPGSYLVLWHALQDAILAGRDFDFEGSGLRGVEPFYRRWGASAVPIWRIRKSGTWRGELVQMLLHRRAVRSVERRTA